MKVIMFVGLLFSPLLIFICEYFRLPKAVINSSFKLHTSVCSALLNTQPLGDTCEVVAFQRRFRPYEQY